MKEKKETKKENKLNDINNVRLEGIDPGGERVLVTMYCKATQEYLKDNPMFINTDLGHPTRIGKAGYNEKTKKGSYNQTIVDTKQLPEFWLIFLAIQTEVRKLHRKPNKVIDNINALYEIASRRPNNFFIIPEELDELDPEVLTSLQQDLEAILVREGYWDKENNIETEKAKELRN